jgi:hypothetical protein
MQLRRRGMAGVTLLEIIISFFILCVAAISASSLISYGHKTTKADFRQGESLQILVDRMNSLSALPFSKFKEALAAGASVELTDTFNDIEFGPSIAVGPNKYRVTGEVSYQSVTFDNLKQLRFPNPEYTPDNPKTWYFQTKTPSAETFGNVTGDYAYAVVKLVVSVQPIEGDRANERSVSAMTFVCNTEE